MRRLRLRTVGPTSDIVHQCCRHTNLISHLSHWATTFHETSGVILDICASYTVHMSSITTASASHLIGHRRCQRPLASRGPLL